MHEDLTQLDAAVTIPDVFIRKRAGGTMTAKHAQTGHRSNDYQNRQLGASLVGTSSDQITNSQMNTGGPLSPRHFAQI